MKKISVVMSVYNGEKYLREAVESILSQSFSDFEFIIVDDGSDDSTYAVLSSYAEKDRRIKLLRNSHNLGLAESLNKALEAAGGDFIARQDADDISFPERLQVQYEYLTADPDISVCSVYSWIAGEDGTPVYSFKYPVEHDNIVYSLEKGENPLIHGSVMLRRDILADIPKPPYRFGLAQDLDLWLRISQSAKFAVIPEELYLYRRGQGNISTKSSSCRKRNRELILQLHKERKEYGQEKTDWKSASDCGKDSSTSSFTGDKSYVPGYLFLLAGKQRSALKYFFSNIRFKFIPLIILALLPGAGTVAARFLHIRLSPWKNCKFRD